MKSSCENCSNYVFDEEYDCYLCDVSMDEDEHGRFLSSSEYQCPYFQLLDDYKIVRKQM